MLLTRKLLLLVATAIVAMAAFTGSAGAALIAASTGSGDTPCPAVMISGHTVTGGCHFEFESTGFGIPFHALIGPNKVTISNCEVRFEARLDGGAEGYVTEANLTAPHGGSVGCTQRPCDEDSGATDTFIPWRLHIREHGVGDEQAELALCLRTGGTEGSAGLRCEVHLEFTPLPNDNYEIGHVSGSAGVAEFCENNPPNPEGLHPTLNTIVSIEPHLVTFGTEQLEIIH